MFLQDGSGFVTAAQLIATMKSRGLTKHGSVVYSAARVGVIGQARPFRGGKGEGGGAGSRQAPGPPPSEAP